VHSCTPVTHTDYTFMHTCSLHSCAHMHNCQRNNCARVCKLCFEQVCIQMHAFFPIWVPPCMAVPITTMHTQACENPSIARALGGPPSQNPSIRPSIRTLPKIEILITMQEDTTTNLALTNPRSTGSISQNLQISSQTSRKLTMTAGTNEVALWALQLYIVPFAKLP
jgi:hypothetical protein